MVVSKVVFRADQGDVEVVRGVRRIDLAVEPMGKPELMENGWLRCEAVLTKTGVFKYQNGDGTERRELRLPQHVFDSDSMKSFHLVPVTDDHPDVGWLDAQNAKNYACGSADMPVKDGDRMRAKLLITDAALVSKIMNRDKAQVSNGYFADLEFRSGEYDGEPFDAVQTNIRGNHVAVVDEARAGPEARIKLDSLGERDGFMVRVVQGARPEPFQETQMPKLKIDGVEFEAPEQTIQAFEKKLRKLDEKASEKDSKVEELTALLGKAEGERDAVKSQVVKLDSALRAARDPKALAAYVNARVDLVAKARGVLGDDFKADGLTDREVKAAVVAKLQPTLKLDGKGDEYVTACFDALSVKSDTENPALARVREEIYADDRDDSVVLDARDKFIQESQNLWKKPLPASAKRSGAK
jgi:hypothetical protein